MPINLPESWACIDCGINTAPGCFNRQAMQHALAADWNDQGVNQTVDERSEVYMVKAKVWNAAGMSASSGCLCIGCLEQRIGRTLTRKDFTLGDDFRDVRFDLFGSDETRQMADMRRSGADEAFAGGVELTHLAHAMGNSVDQNKKLLKTYCPINVVSLIEVNAARDTGAKRILKANEKSTGKAISRNTPDYFVGTVTKGSAK